MRPKRTSIDEQFQFIMEWRESGLSEKDMISQLNTTIKMLNDTIAKQQAENDNLKAELAWFRQKMFGSSSERRKDEIVG